MATITKSFWFWKLAAGVLIIVVIGVIHQSQSGSDQPEGTTTQSVETGEPAGTGQNPGSDAAAESNPDEETVFRSAQEVFEYIDSVKPSKAEFTLRISDEFMVSGRPDFGGLGALMRRDQLKQYGYEPDGQEPGEGYTTHRYKKVR